jgi:hypothetical protein
MATQPHYVSETQVLRSVACNANCRYIWTTHALVQMARRKVSAADIEFALMNGQVTLQEQKQDRLWRVTGRDIDGGIIEVVVAVSAEAITIKVVTAF